jgi:cyclopropane-fatty-acyl-phospholipid synthase
MATQAEISHAYDLDNSFFRLWLDRNMNYSCGLHEDSGSEEEAQNRKLAWICRAARVTPEMRVLDIGCGWGAALDYMVKECGVGGAHGLTLSQTQYSEIRGQAHPRVSVSYCSYLDFRPQAKFEAVISIGMLEHVVRPQDARGEKQLEIYQQFFRLVHEWTNPDAWFGLQVIHTTRIPRDPLDLRDLVWGSKTIFPGSLAPRMEVIIQALRPFWEVMEVRTRREDYAKTTREWHRRLCAQEAVIREKWGDRIFADYERYLSSCVRMFEKDYLTLGQYSLRRRPSRAAGAG